MVLGAAALTKPNGSLDEAFPNESSFCVTALAAFDLLSAAELVGSEVDQRTRDQWIEVARPMIAFLGKADERHGLISNHLATAAAALYKWSALTGEPGEKRGEVFLDRILQEQSEEGWFREYEGADPGYQSLCTHYLADLHRIRPDLGLVEPLTSAMRFLWFFAHPDGSFGGLYGSRNTRFYYPGGIEYLGREIPEAAALAQYMKDSIARRTTVTLEVMDEPNLIPMFNSYAWAAAIASAEGSEALVAAEVPAATGETWRKEFPEAGILIDSGPLHYTVVSTKKGGVCCHFPRDGRAPTVDPGVVIKDRAGRLYSTQFYSPRAQVSTSKNSVSITTTFIRMQHRLPSPSQFVVLRALSITVMRNLMLGNLVKRALVKLLITGKRPIRILNRRTIRFGPELSIKDEVDGRSDSSRYERVKVKRPFHAIHMASQGYWQIQDELE